MFASIRSRLWSLAAAVLAVGGFATPASAGWITVRNDTSKAIVVQESVLWDGEFQRGKPVRLLPGESSCVFVKAPTIRRLEVFDGRNPTQALRTATITGKDENQAFSVTCDGKAIHITPVAPPTTAPRILRRDR